MFQLFYFSLIFKLACGIGDTYPKHFDHPQIPVSLEKIHKQSKIVEAKSFELESYFDEYRRLSKEEQNIIGKQELNRRFQLLKTEEEKLNVYMLDFKELLRADNQPQK